MLGVQLQSQIIKKIKTVIWGLIGSAAISMIIGVSFSGWILGSTTLIKRKEVARVAIAERLTPMCMAKFNQDPGRNTKLKEMQTIDVWRTERYVIDQGWPPWLLKKRRTALSQITVQR